jgi:hypothetical protein
MQITVNEWDWMGLHGIGRDRVGVGGSGCERTKGQRVKNYMLYIGSDMYLSIVSWVPMEVKLRKQVVTTAEGRPLYYFNPDYFCDLHVLVLVYRYTPSGVLLVICGSLLLWRDIVTFRNFVVSLILSTDWKSSENLTRVKNRLLVFWVLSLNKNTVVLLNRLLRRT